MKYIEAINGKAIVPDEDEALRIEFLWMKGTSAKNISKEMNCTESQMLAYLRTTGLMKKRLDIEDAIYIQSKQKKAKVFKPSPYVAGGKQYWDYTEIFINTGDYL